MGRRSTARPMNRLVREDLTHIRLHRRCVRSPSFENALVENIATGCTIVLNRSAVDLLASQGPKVSSCTTLGPTWSFPAADMSCTTQYQGCCTDFIGSKVAIGVRPDVVGGVVPACPPS